MKISLRFLSLLVALTASTAASESDDFAAVRRADERRIVATIASDTATLARLLSDELHYTNSDGRVQTKTQLIAAAAGRKVKYLSVVLRDVSFQTIVPGAVVMSGRARLAAEADGRRFEFTLRFLAVWRKEADEWLLLSYQSSPLAEVTAPPAN